MNKYQQTRVFLYRVVEKDSKGRQKRHLAEVRADCDENARRKIIHTALAEGGCVQVIISTEDRRRYPGDTAKRTYHD